MAETRLAVEIDGDRLDDEALRSLVDVQVEESLDVADAATIAARLAAAGDGEWRSVLDRLTEPRTPLAIEVARGGVGYRFDGFSTQATWSVDAGGESLLTVAALDRTLEMDLEEKVVPWPGSSDSAIARAIISSYGLRPQVDDTPDEADPDVHVVVQRATDLAFLRSLAGKWGYSAFVEADAVGGTGHFRAVDPHAEPQGELELGFGGDAPRAEVRVELTAGQAVEAARVPGISDSPASAREAGDDQAQGARSLGGQVDVLLSPADVDGEVEPGATARALARRSSYGVELTAELDTERAGLVVRARRPVLVRGLGSDLSGRYMVRSVRHLVTLDRHRQRLSLVRNALGLRGDERFGAGGPL